MSITVKFDKESIKRVEEQTRTAFEKVIANRKLLNEVGEIVVTDIQFQTRRGQSIPNKARLKPLSKSWKEIRARIAESTDTHETYSPRRSNLTLTGQLLESLTWRIVKSGVIETLFKGSRRRPYFIRRKRDNSLRTIESKISNEELAEYVQKDRPFVGVRPQVVDRIKLKVIEYLRRSSRVLNLFR
jgi:hypothetical protein